MCFLYGTESGIFVPDLVLFSAIPLDTKKTTTMSSSTPQSNPGYVSPKKDPVAIVTGSSGFVGSRLVEMLLERGSKIVIAFDIMKPDFVLEKRFKDIEIQTGGQITFATT